MFIQRSIFVTIVQISSLQRQRWLKSHVSLFSWSYFCSSDIRYGIQSPFFQEGIHSQLFWHLVHIQDSKIWFLWLGNHLCALTPELRQRDLIDAWYCFHSKKIDSAYNTGYLASRQALNSCAGNNAENRSLLLLWHIKCSQWRSMLCEQYSIHTYIQIFWFLPVKSTGAHDGGGLHGNILELTANSPCFDRCYSGR